MGLLRENQDIFTAPKGQSSKLAPLPQKSPTMHIKAPIQKPKRKIFKPNYFSDCCNEPLPHRRLVANKKPKCSPTVRSPVAKVQKGSKSSIKVRQILISSSTESEYEYFLNQISRALDRTQIAGDY